MKFPVCELSVLIFPVVTKLVPSVRVFRKAELKARIFPVIFVTVVEAKVEEPVTERLV